MGKKITVTGATGNIGSMVLPALLAAGADVTILSRDKSKVQDLIDKGVNVVEGDFDNTEAIAKAFEGAESALLIAPPNPDAAKQMSNLIQGIKAAGNNTHVVRISAIGAAHDAPTENGKLHAVSDDELVATGLPYTILRPHFFMNNLFMSVGSIAEQGQMYWGMGDGQLGMVDVRDIVEPSVKILLEGGHEGKIYTPTGATSINFTEAAKIISEEIGKEVTYVPVTFEQVREAILGFGWGEWGAQIMHDYSKAYSENWGNFVNDDVEAVTGKKSRDFRTFVKEVLAGALQPQAA